MNPQQILDSFNNFIFAPHFSGGLWFIRALFILASAALLSAIVYLIAKTNWKDYRYVRNAKEFFGPKYFEVKGFLKHWEGVTNRLKSTKEAEWKLAIIEANNFFGEILGRLGITGENLAEQLQKVEPTTLTQDVSDKVLEAYQVCTNVIHDPDYRLTIDRAEKTIGIYERALKSLDIL